MKRDFIRFLGELDEEELREEFRALYQRFPTVREYYRMELAEDTKAVLDKYKREMRKSFFPSRGRGKRGRSVSRKVIKAFREIAVHQKDVVELYFYRAELMTEYIKANRIDGDAFHESTVKAFEEACALAEKEVLLDYFSAGTRELCELFDHNRRARRYSFWPVYLQYYS